MACRYRFFMAVFPRDTGYDLRQGFDLVREMNAARGSFNIFDPNARQFAIRRVHRAEGFFSVKRCMKVAPSWR